MVVAVLTNANDYTDPVPSAGDWILDSDRCADLQWAQRLSREVVSFLCLKHVLCSPLFGGFRAYLPFSCERTAVRWHTAAQGVAKYHLSRRAPVSSRRVSQFEQPTVKAFIVQASCNSRFCDEILQRFDSRLCMAVRGRIVRRRENVADAPSPQKRLEVVTGELRSTIRSEPNWNTESYKILSECADHLARSCISVGEEM